MPSRATDSHERRAQGGSSSTNIVLTRRRGGERRRPEPRRAPHRADLSPPVRARAVAASMRDARVRAGSMRASFRRFFPGLECPRIGMASRQLPAIRRSPGRDHRPRRAQDDHQRAQLARTSLWRTRGLERPDLRTPSRDRAIRAMPSADDRLPESEGKEYALADRTAVPSSARALAPGEARPDAGARFRPPLRLRCSSSTTRGS
jgi:hypothetical protein